MSDPRKNRIDESNQVSWGIIASVGIGMLAFAAPLVLMGVIIGIVAAFKGLTVDELVEVSDVYLLNFAASLGIAVTCCMIIYSFVKNKGGIQSLGFVKTRAIDILMAFPAYVAYFIALIGALRLVEIYATGVDLEQDQVIGFENAVGINLVLAFVTLVIIAPFYEEVLFRGFIFRGIASKMGFWPAAIGTSLMFAVAHQQINVGIDTFILGIAACWLVWSSKSIWPAILLHSIKNFIAFIVLFIL